MSGAYFVEGASAEQLEALAPLLGAQIAYGDKDLHHYAISGNALFGSVGRDLLSQGVMPRYCADSKLWGVLQGELYDCAALRRLKQQHGEDKDDLALLAALHRNGALHEELAALNGAYFLMLWDPETETLVCASDRYSLYPMYWAHNGGKFCVADRCACAVLAGVVTGEVDPQGVAMMLTLDDYIGHTTLVRGVQTFPQATILVKRGDTLTWTPYWHYDFKRSLPYGTVAETAEAMGAQFVDAVQRACKPGRRIGVTLSGGLDSRLIVAAATQAGVPLQTFTWGKAKSFDRQFAKAVANHFGAQHHDCDYEYMNFESRYLDECRIAEGLFDYFDSHMMAHLHRMDAQVDLILNGYAGDLVLGGSYLRAAWMKDQPFAELANRLYQWRNVLLPESRLTEAMTPDAVPAEHDLPSVKFRALMEPLEGIHAPDLADRFFLENRPRRSTSMGTVIMRAVVESSAPFFDYDFMDSELHVPAEYRFEHRIYKEIMRTSFPDTLKLRWQRTLLPAGYPEWMSIPAKAFLKGAGIAEKRVGWPRIASRQSPVDFPMWLRGPLRGWMSQVCMDPHPVTDDVLQPAFCERIWNQHLDGQDRTRYLGAITAIRGFGRILGDARNRVSARQVESIRVDRENARS